MKKIVFLTLMFVLMFSINVCAKDIRVTIDGREVEFNDDLGRPFVDENSRTLVPLRAVMESFGCEVEGVQNEGGGHIVVKKGVSDITLYINSNSFMCSDYETHYMDTKPVIINNRTYLPIRFIIEAFGGTVNWIQDTYTVEILSGLGVHTILPDANCVKVHYLYDDREYGISGRTSIKIDTENMSNLNKSIDLVEEAMTSIKSNKPQEANDKMAMAGTYLQNIKYYPIEEYPHYKMLAEKFDTMLKTYTYEVYAANESTTSTSKKTHLMNALDVYAEFIKSYNDYLKKWGTELTTYYNENNSYGNKD